MQHFDGARLSPNSVPNAVWHALNDPVCQYLRTTNPRSSTVCIDNSLGVSSVRLALYNTQTFLLSKVKCAYMQFMLNVCSDLKYTFINKTAI